MDDKQFYMAIFNMIEVSCKRGCWNGNEMLPIGQIRSEVESRLKPFMNLEGEKGKPKEKADNAKEQKK